MALFYLLLMFFRIGLFSFGGGYAMLPLIFQGIQEFGFMSGEDFSKLVALSQVTPGPIAINAATYVGYQYAGIPGAIAATIGVILPSVLLVLLVSHFLTKFKESRALTGILEGIRPAALGLLASAVIFLARESIFTGIHLNLLPMLFFIIVVFVNGKYKISPITLTILAGFAGAFIIR